MVLLVYTTTSYSQYNARSAVFHITAQ